MTQTKQPFYGWYLLAAACFVYGFGITPGYYSWGQLFPGLSEDLGYTRTDLGGIFGLFAFLYGGVGPIVGWAQQRFSIRAVMTFGSICAALGFFIVSLAETKLAIYIGFSILGGGGIGLSTIIPCQTLGQNWFLKRRALAIAVIMSAGGLVTPLVTNVDAYMLKEHDWRTGWQVIALLSVAVAVVAVLFIRDTPEQLGQHRDGIAPDKRAGRDASGATQAGVADAWTAAQAFRTYQFWLIVVAGTAYAVPWGVVISHGPSHLLDNGFTTTMIGAVMPTAGLVSIFGRLTGMAGDWVRPQLVLRVALIIEGIGSALWYHATSTQMAFIALLLVGLGFGAAYVSIPVVFSHFFGRRAFGMTSGVRMLFTAIFNGLAPLVAGMIYDRTGSYLVPFYGLLVICLIGALAATLAKDPGAPPGEVSNTAEQSAAAA